ncbi:MAG: hypothetical protein JO187_01095 [Acidobacteria bacterium]|nr:hypothetical protein [Acidobacteriota bacterium]
MTISSAKPKDYYSEAEAAATLGISISRLHMLLDHNVFNNGMHRPADLMLRASDLIVLGFWNKSHQAARILEMPKR